MNECDEDPEYNTPGGNNVDADAANSEDGWLMPNYKLNITNEILFNSLLLISFR